MINVLFVSSGNFKHGISPIILNQGQSLIKEGVYIEYFLIKGKGFWNYIKGVFKLRKYLRDKSFNIVHAHYSFSGFVASLAGCSNVITSLMGSDVKSEKIYRFSIYIFYKLFWAKVIVKSDDMKKTLGFKNVEIIPNGVDMNKFKPIEKEFAIDKVSWNREKYHVLFPSNPGRKEKNFSLAEKALKICNNSDIDLHFLIDIPNSEVPYHINAADVVLLTSLWEGSPNVIKEAMACNRPIITTKVGDVASILGKTKGCYIVNFDANEIAIKIQKAIDFNKQFCRTKGRSYLIQCGLDDASVAKKLMHVYQNIIA